MKALSKDLSVWRKEPKNGRKKGHGAENGAEVLKQTGCSEKREGGKG